MIGSSNRAALEGIDVSNYIGQWVVICNKQVIAHDKRLINLSKEIDSCKTTPTVAKIPKEEVRIF